jgi:hypothetical protein
MLHHALVVRQTLRYFWPTRFRAYGWQSFPNRVTSELPVIQARFALGVTRAGNGFKKAPMSVDLRMDSQEGTAACSQEGCVGFPA